MHTHTHACHFLHISVRTLTSIHFRFFSAAWPWTLRTSNEMLNTALIALASMVSTKIPQRSSKETLGTLVPADFSSTVTLKHHGFDLQLIQRGYDSHSNIHEIAQCIEVFEESEVFDMWYVLMLKAKIWQQKQRHLSEVSYSEKWTFCSYCFQITLIKILLPRLKLTYFPWYCTYFTSSGKKTSRCNPVKNI